MIDALATIFRETVDDTPSEPQLENLAKTIKFFREGWSMPLFEPIATLPEQLYVSIHRSWSILKQTLHDAPKLRLMFPELSVLEALLINMGFGYEEPARRGRRRKNRRSERTVALEVQKTLKSMGYTGSLSPNYPDGAVPAISAGILGLIGRKDCTPEQIVLAHRKRNRSMKR